MMRRVLTLLMVLDRDTPALQPQPPPVLPGFLPLMQVAHLPMQLACSQATALVPTAASICLTTVRG